MPQNEIGEILLARIFVGFFFFLVFVGRYPGYTNSFVAISLKKKRRRKERNRGNNGKAMSECCAVRRGGVEATPQAPCEL
jgi:hypothetical protein